MSVTVGADERVLRHVPALDGVRGVAVLLVVALHAGFVLRPGFSGLVPGGFLGVDLFFVLSGFLITSLLLTERARRGSIDLRRFYARRAYRLLPALVGLLIAHIGYAVYLDVAASQEIKAQLSVLFYVANWVQAYGFVMPEGLGHTWTLSVEEQFYVLWPALLLLLTRLRSRRLILLWIVGAIVASALVRAWIWRYGAGFPAAYVRTDARADELLIGAWCAFAWRWKLIPDQLAKVAGTVSLLGLAALVIFWDPTSTSMFYGGYTLVGVAGGSLILAVMSGDWRPTELFEHPALRAVGRVSYGLYLWHVPCLYAIPRELSGQPKWVQAAAGLAASALLTYLSWRFVEQPFLRRKDRMRTAVEPLAAGAEPPRPAGAHT